MATRRKPIRGLALSLAALAWGGNVGDAGELPTNNDPNRQIRFATLEEAEERRQKLIRTIWSEGLPIGTQPAVRAKVGQEIYGEHLARLDPKSRGEVDELVVEVLGMKSLVYLIHPPKAAKKRLAIVHEGHARRGKPLNDGIDAAAHFFLKRGFSVCIVQMPLYGWNSDETMSLAVPSKSEPVEASAKHHNAMFDVVASHGLPPAMALQPFLEPAVVAVNHWMKTTGSEDITLVGLSGGGWATHLLAALDPRIRLSIPVAGSYPLYIRNKDARSRGDKEQWYEPIFAEDIAEDETGGGVCTWLEVYALGGIGASRKQVMVTAEFDSCCFSGRYADTFKEVVQKSVEKVGKGSWNYALDSSHRSHQISEWVIENVITPNLPKSEQTLVDIEYLSAADNSMQRAMWFDPEPEKAVPLVVALHTWSGDYKQKHHQPIREWCMKRGWAYIHPNFRGPAKRPEATGSELVVKDIVSAVDFAKKTTEVDSSAVFLVGTSGGGYHCLVMAGKHPEIWAGVSAWASISDLRAWYDEQNGQKYANDIVMSCGGKPGDSPEVDEQYRVRSPLTYLANAKGRVPLHINTGIKDGHTGSVPISHSLLAFNEVAEPEDHISQEDVRFFTEKARVPEKLKKDTPDPSYGEKKPLFRRSSGKATVTIFDGGHEIVPEAAIAWIEGLYLEK